MHIEIQSIQIEFKSCEMFAVSDFVDMFFVVIAVDAAATKCIRYGIFAFYTLQTNKIHIEKEK